MMFGRIRGSSSSPESLERLPSKILKGDSFSIYEATLVKLKLGSQRDLSSPLKDAEVETTSSSWKMEADLSSKYTAKNSPESMITELMAIDFDFSSSSSQDFGNSEESSKFLNKKNVSIHYLFSKFKSSHHSSAYHEAITSDAPRELESV